jgi:hypothetical protein
MCQDLKKGTADVVLCWHTDRLHRDNTELEDYIRIVEPRDIRTETVIGGILDLNTAGGRANARFLCTVARLEVETRSERVRVAKAHRAREGRFMGGVRPYGFEADGITQREPEAAVIRQGAKGVLANVPIKEIVRGLTRKGITDRNGRPWDAERFRRMLMRPRNAGLVPHMPGSTGGRVFYSENDIVASLPGTPIIEPDEYWSLIHKLSDPERRTNHAWPGPKWFGTGIFQCPCGQRLRVGKKIRTRKDRQTGQIIRTEVKIYRCTRTDAGHATCPMAELDALVIGTLLELIRTSDPADIIPEAPGMANAAELRAELAAHRAKLDEIAADYDDDKITRSQMLTRTDKRRAKIAVTEAQLAALAESHNPAIKLVGADDITQAWRALTFGEQREITRRLLAVKILPVGRGRHVAARDRVQIRKRRTRAPQAA